MIKNEAKAEINDVNGAGIVTMEVNFDDNFKDCVKITVEGVKKIIKYSDLFEVMFMIANKEQQAKMVPVKEELGYQYMKKIRVKLKRDLKEGDMVVINVPINVPKIIEDQILAKKELSTPEIKSPYLTPGIEE